jgi:hypothetical protein
MSVRSPALPAALICVLLAACAGETRCMKPQDYQNAETFDPIHPVGDLKVPSSPSALVIPPPPADPVPFGYRNAQGDVVCLERPPHIEVPDAPQGEKQQKQGR